MAAQRHKLLLILVSIVSFLCVTRTTSRPEKKSSNLEDISHTMAETERSLNVLIMTLPAPGHTNPLLALGEELVRRGHNVTFLMTTLPAITNKTVEKVRVHGMTFLSAGESLMAREREKMMSYKVTSSVLTVATKIVTILPQEMAIVAESLDRYLAMNSVDMLIATDFMEAILQCFGAQWNIRRVLLSTTLQYQPHTLPHWPWPGLFAGSVSDNLTFLQRLRLTLTRGSFQLLYVNVLKRLLFSSLQAYCPSITLNQATAASGVYIPQIVSSVIGFEYPRTISPLTTYVGPVLTRDPDPISTDLQEWLDSKEVRSVVYVSMGSAIVLNKEKGAAILNGVLSTNYSLLWSLRESNRDILEGVELDYKQVHLLNWAPQLAVLGHRAIRMAIVHGGTNGVHESLYNEVPLIILPGNGDQMANAGRVHHQGLGIHLHESDITESGVIEAIKKIDEGAYRENVQRLKKSFVDAGGRERAAELIEFYAEIGYSHLVPAYAKYDWSWVQFYNADVYLIVLLVLLFVSYLAIKCCRYFCKSVFCRRLSKEKSD